MTSVDSASRAQPPRQSSSPAPGARVDPSDARAMREAIDAARAKVDKFEKFEKGEKFGGQSGKRAQAKAAGEQPRQGEVARQGQSYDQQTRLYHQREGVEALAGWNGQNGAIAPVQVQANPNAAHVDPGAFAQMLADLWTRENGRGSKEVRVRFGDRAWPATGARLIRNEAGALDVALFVGDGGRAYGDRLPGLEDALAQAGVDLGSLAIETGGDLA